jgi:hypothetical protein
MIHFRQKLLLNSVLHDLEIVTMNGGENISQYHTLLTVAKFTGKWKKNSIQLLYSHTAYSKEYLSHQWMLWNLNFSLIEGK